MGAKNGANMLRVLGVLTTAALMADAGHAPAASAVRVSTSSTTSAAAIDVTALLAAARGAPPLICGLAAQSVGNGNWGWTDAPAPPLGAAARPEDNDGRRMRDLSEADVTRLLDALSSDDACVRELSVRLVGHQDESRVAAPLISK